MKKPVLEVVTPHGTFKRATDCDYTCVAVWGPEPIFASWHRTEALARKHSRRPLLGIYPIEKAS